MSCTLGVFMVEFHAMLDMNRISVSSAYGSWLVALVITMCIRPCEAIGTSHEYALSMRSGLPNSSITRSSGRGGQPSGGRDSGVFGALMMSMLFFGNWCGGIGFG